MGRKFKTSLQHKTKRESKQTTRWHETTRKVEFQNIYDYWLEKLEINNDYMEILNPGYIFLKETQRLENEKELLKI